MNGPGPGCPSTRFTKGRNGLRKRLIAYRKRIDALLADGSVEVDWSSVIDEHLAQISFFQHERLIHLLVTLAFAFMGIGATVAAIAFPQPLTLVLMLVVMALLVAYIIHYWFLENETQRLYAQYDLMLERLRMQ